MTDPSIIKGYHAHIYYPDDDARERASRLRDAIDRTFTVTLGRWRDEPVGPHPVAMYQVAFEANQFADIVPWLMLNRDGLTIVVVTHESDIAAMTQRTVRLKDGKVVPDTSTAPRKPIPAAAT